MRRAMSFKISHKTVDRNITKKKISLYQPQPEKVKYDNILLSVAYLKLLGKKKNHFNIFHGRASPPYSTSNTSNTSYFSILLYKQLFG